MLYDPKWEKRNEKKLRDPFSLESLIAWLEKQPPNDAYDWQDTGYGTRGCLLIQYFRAEGFRNARGGATVVRYDRWLWSRQAPIPEQFVDVAATKPFIVSAALARARKILREGSLY